MFVSIPISGMQAMTELFRRRVIWLLVEKELLSKEFACNLLSWKNPGFNWVLAAAEIDQNAGVTWCVPGTPPAMNDIPVTTITETVEYTGTVTWLPADNPFELATIYTAIIALTAKPAHTCVGVTADCFTVAGANTVSNLADSNVVLAAFPGTWPGDLVHIDSDDQGESAIGVWGDGSFVYLANKDGGILSYSVDGLGNLSHIDSDDQGDLALGVWGDGNFIYLANGLRGIHTYKVE